MSSKELSQAIECHDSSVGIFMAIGDVPPAMGMIGTSIGLVQMLSVMDGPRTISPPMAVVLLTTLHGAVIACAFAIPRAHLGRRLSNRLR